MWNSPRRSFCRRWPMRKVDVLWIMVFLLLFSALFYMNDIATDALFGPDQRNYSMANDHLWNKDHKSSGSGRSLDKCDAYLLILSSVAANASRMAIRSGYLKDLKEVRGRLAFNHKFVLGHDEAIGQGNSIMERLREEISLYNDILILPFVDSYWNLTVKVNLMFKAPIVLNKGCKYIVKLDSDVYVRAKRFTAIIRGLPSTGLVYGGYYYDQVKRVMPVPRNISYKFSFTVEEYPEKLFNPYIGGPIYFMSNTVAKSLPYTIIQYLKGNGEIEEVPSTYTINRPVIYRLEDVYMGYLIAKMQPKVLFLHIPKLILEFDHVRERAQVALHNVRDPAVMSRGKELLG